ncbi:MAG: hypothetical protein FWC16_13730 [Defluviitaleaceae bacterium]|nr:hypothetical protein [Defluviitaleaceae bacterium]MCL2275974.1 hypothetical protein [Defluviitaleaceae bacterium]
MQAVKGLVTEGRFTPANNTPLPHYAHAILIIEETPLPTPKEDDMQARLAWLEELRLAREYAKDEPLPPFPPRTPMELPHGLTD